MSTAARTRFFDLPAEERKAITDAAYQRVVEEGHRIAAEYNARKPDPRSIHDYRAYHTMGLVCVLVVKHRDKPASIEVSRAGEWPHIYLPTRKIIVQPESTPEFVLAMIPKSFIAWLSKQTDAPKGADQLLGITPDLASEWTDAQRETWERLKRTRSSINTKIYYAKKRPASVLSRSAVA